MAGNPFLYKPGDVYASPTFVAPHQPRLDWQMWFAALGNYQGAPWFIHFVDKLLEGSKAVIGLIDAENTLLRKNRPLTFGAGCIIMISPDTILVGMLTLDLPLR